MQKADPNGPSIPQFLTIDPLLMQLPSEGEQYPYIGIDNLITRYHRWKDIHHAHDWLHTRYRVEAR